MFILDTDIVSNLRKKKPHPQLVGWIGAVGWKDLATTVMTIMEIQIGIERARRTHPSVAEQAEEWFVGLLADGNPQIFGLDSKAAVLLGRMYETPALRNFLIADAGAKKLKTGADLAIAAIAITQAAVVASNNDKDFLAISAHFPLPGLFNPIDGKWLIKGVVNAV